MITLEDLQIIIYGLGIIGFFLFVFSILVGFSLIRMERHFKDLVDLEYKKYEEQHGKTTDSN